MSNVLVTSVAVVGVTIGAALQHWTTAVHRWWVPEVCPALSEGEVAAELRAWKEASVVSHLATGIAVGSVVALTLVSIYIAASFRPSLAPNAERPAALPLAPAAAAAPVVSAAPSSGTQYFNLEDDLDAIDLWSVQPKRK